MKIKQTYKVTPSALMHFITSLDSCHLDVSYDEDIDKFIVDVLRETSYYELQMEILSNIRDTFHSDEDEFSALNEGISAIKTLLDMGVLS